MTVYRNKPRRASSGMDTIAISRPKSKIVMLSNFTYSLMNNLGRLGYFSDLMANSIREFSYCNSYLTSLFRRNLTDTEFKQYAKLLHSVSFNSGLMNPMFIEYTRLIGVHEALGKEYSLLVSALMLLEDILLDEVKESIDTVATLFSGSVADYPHPLTRLTSNVLHELKTKFPSQAWPLQLDLIMQLNSAQMQSLDFACSVEDLWTNIIAKGLWLPTLAFGHNMQMAADEIIALKHIGAWIKLADDAGDVDKDLQQGIVTLFTHPHTKATAADMVEHLRRQAFELVAALPYTEFNKRRFLYRMSVQTICFEKYNQRLNRELKILKPLAEANLWIALALMSYSSLFALKQFYGLSS